MSQTYTVDCFDKDNIVQTDMGHIEENFAALKSAFSGATEPSAALREAGMWWLDTTAHILKQRNEANNAWLSVWDMANNKPVITNLSNEITGAMIVDALKNPAVGTAGLRSLGISPWQALPGDTSLIPEDNSVTFEKIQHGTITILSYSEEQTAKSAAYIEINPKHTCIYIPADATLIKMVCDLKVTTPFAWETYIKFTVEGTDSSEAFTTFSGAWQVGKTCTLDVSGKGGSNTIKVYIKSQHAADATYHVRNICMYWE